MDERLEWELTAGEAGGSDMELDAGSEDGIETRSVHEEVAEAGAYELPPPLTESELDDDDVPILAASEYDEEPSTTQPLYAASMYARWTGRAGLTRAR